jgi:hypothetical protein
VKQGHYGYPCVTNPNDFEPDPECCSPAEIEAHRLAKKHWGTPAFVPNRGCTDLLSPDGRVVGHVTRTSWGIGVNFINQCDECNTPDDDLMYCHDCALDLCPVCWPKHEQWHDEGSA